MYNGRDCGDAESLEAVQVILEQLQQRETLSSGLDDNADAAARRQLQRLADSIGSISRQRGTHARHSARSVLAALSSLTRLCDHKFVTFSYSAIPIAWREIYVDAQLLKACCTLKISSSNEEDDAYQLRQCICDLDLALIVAGAASLFKDQPCHDLIARLQGKLLGLYSQRQQQQSGHDDLDDGSRYRKRYKASPSKSGNANFKTSGQADLYITEYEFDQAPTLMDLSSADSTARSKPFIVRGYAQHAGWPAVQSDSRKGSWSSIDHLLMVAGPARVVPVEVGANYTRADWGQDIMLWSDFLEHCGWEQSSSPSKASVKSEEPGTNDLILYMAQHDLTSQFPALQQDYSLPDYVYTAPPAPKDWPEYKPPTTDDAVITNLWIGPAGTVSPPHHDPYYNCFVQAVGYKEVWVSPPHLRPRKHVEPSQGESSLANSASKASISETLMANTASIDVFDMAESISPDVRAAAAKAILGPGDLLYMPPGWWHSLRSLTRSFSVSSWF